MVAFKKPLGFSVEDAPHPGGKRQVLHGRRPLPAVTLLVGEPNEYLLVSGSIVFFLNRRNTRVNRLGNLLHCRVNIADVEPVIDLALLLHNHPLLHILRLLRQLPRQVSRPVFLELNLLYVAAAHRK